MTIDELKQVVAKIQLGDNRQVDRLVLEYWWELIGPVHYEDALAAVSMHRREKPGVWLEPGHVIADAKRAKETRERIARRSPDADAIEQRNKALGVGPIVFDRTQFEAETRAAIEATRRSKPNPVGPIDKEDWS
jgi:hypothetical protein